MTILEVIQRSTEFLGRKGVDSPRLQVELLIAHVLNVPRIKLYTDYQRELTETELELIRDLVKHRGQRQPLQHIIGSTSFCGLELRVTPDVLVPRPETELLAEAAWKFLNALPSPSAETLRGLDFGTGSGCLAIAIAVHAPAVEIFALDISEAALRIARENAVRHQVAGRIQFLKSDCLAALRQPLPFDLIVSNPPYIPSSEIATLTPEVRDHDPRLALDGGADGLEFYRRFAREVAPFLRSSGKLMLELGDHQEQAVREIFSQGKWSVGSVQPDYTGRPRILIARVSES